IVRFDRKITKNTPQTNWWKRAEFQERFRIFFIMNLFTKYSFLFVSTTNEILINFPLGEHVVANTSFQRS
ncbi:hypothetical protein L9F63_018220, partial [Diploptera punctata]